MPEKQITKETVQATVNKVWDGYSQAALYHAEIMYGKYPKLDKWAEKYWQGVKDGYRKSMVTITNELDIKPLGDKDSHGGVDVAGLQDSSQGGTLAPPEDILRSMIKDVHRILGLHTTGLPLGRMAIRDMERWLRWYDHVTDHCSLPDKRGGK